MRVPACLPLICIGIALHASSMYAQTWDEEDMEGQARNEILSDERDAQREMDKRVYGRVTAIDPDRNIISLVPTKWVDNGTNMGPEEKYLVESDATFTGRSSLEKISVGDYLTIDYYVYGDLNWATDIIFEKEGEGESESSSGVKYDVPKALTD